MCAKAHSLATCSAEALEANDDRWLADRSAFPRTRRRRRRIGVRTASSATLTKDTYVSPIFSPSRPRPMVSPSAEGVAVAGAATAASPGRPGSRAGSALPPASHAPAKPAQGLGPAPARPVPARGDPHHSLTLTAPDCPGSTAAATAATASIGKGVETQCVGRSGSARAARGERSLEDHGETPAHRPPIPEKFSLA